MIKEVLTVNCIEKSACWYVDTISPYDYIKDINHAVDFAKTIPNIDTCNIFLAGHSQGGSFVSKVGYDRPDIRGILNMAGLAQPVDSISIYQEEFINGNPAGANILRVQFDSLRNGLWPATDTLYNNHFSPRFWLDWISHSDSAVFTQKNSDKPTTLMYGTADRFVPSAIHYQIWLDSITRPNVTFQLFNEIDHGFGIEYDSTMSPQVLNFMTNWINTTQINCGQTNILEVENDKNLLLYPNPANGLILVESQKPEIQKFKLINMLGTTISKGNLYYHVPFQLDIQHLPAGIYAIQTSTSVIKFIKH